ncbi:hypothetical protein SLS53_002625 [Cytospora paraplurivora]|uniref:YggU-like protein n=1 Tax=Cytospora paraplurivora TaxID=2898453 RepID=A0AAN9UFB1_9PEZI
MAAHRFIQYAVASKSKPATVYLQCRVKPNASKVREGITSLTDDAIEVCVSAVPRNGESNKAVLAVLSEALDVAKSDLQITRGAKSRDKVVALGGKSVQDGEVECRGRLLERLVAAVAKNNGGG